LERRPPAWREAEKNIEHPTSNAEHRNFRPSVFNLMFDVERSVFEVPIQLPAVPEANAPPNCAKWHSCCATVTLLALFFGWSENRKKRNYPFVCNASMPFLKLRHPYCIAIGSR
jgi:hypothetical protein